ncbi:hypothetical protein [Methylobacterium sp. Leaf117]|uniref:hypothetical protein n=1 Tax=Methylobacterium sp. Leaf117 TaxID=1736260 RepID=UPI0006F7CEF2|nr:hypothetical protein [Methylobacterium sp. Leaf117]KQP91276.1 hypothetical protein ASF57_23200 [Methylobacterium sp. Leaf117]
MSSDTEKHRELLAALKGAQGKSDGSFEQAVTNAFQHVFDHLGRLNSHVSLGGAEGEDRQLRSDESATLR